MAIISLGIAFCIGCGDSSPQGWERGKSQASGERSSREKPSPKIDDTADNDDTSMAGDSGDPHKMINPHGANPHGDMPMMNTKDEVLENNGKLDLAALHWTVPKSWIRKTPSNGMLLAEFAIPKAEGDSMDARLTVSQAGGSLADNIERWEKQFSEKLDKEEKKTAEIAGVKVTLIELSGTFSDSRGMFAPAGPPRPDYRLLGAIFESDGHFNFIKCTGPAKTIAARSDEIKGFVNSLKMDK